MKNFGRSTIKAKALIEKINKFKKETKKEVEFKSYFKGYTSSIVYNIFVNINYILSLCFTFGVFYGLEIGECSRQMLVYWILTTIISVIYFVIGIKDKNRTLKGQEEYSKWLAHKRFLKDFSRFDKKELPEITLWEKYLVTATVLGCADKVEKQMKMYITDISDIDTNLLIYQSINMNLTRELNKSMNRAISTSSASISSSSYSSGRRLWRWIIWNRWTAGGRRRRRRSFLRETIKYRDF